MESGCPIAVRSPRAAAAIWSLAAALALAGCGRTPPWIPCTDEIVDDVPAPTCDPSCPGTSSVRITMPPTNALIVLDRSCSMATQLDGRSKWSRAVEAVAGMVSDPRAEGMRWGLTLFPDGVVDGMQGPVLVPVAAGQAELVAELLLAALDRSDPNHPQQPGEACYTNLTEATAQLNGRDPFAELDGRSHVVLITDGIGVDTGLAAYDLSQLFEREVPTLVVGFGEEVNADGLQRMGEAGGLPASADVAYYQAGLDDLGLALRQVLQTLRCRQALRLQPEDVGRLSVRTDTGAVILPDPSGVDGWSYDEGTRSISFFGPACDELLAGNITALELALDCS